MTTLTKVLNHMAGVATKRVSRWVDPEYRVPINDRWEDIWIDEAKMQVALDAIEWQPSSIVPIPADVIAAKSGREEFEVSERAAAPKREVEKQLRNDPKLKAETALRARDEDKTIDEIIAETVAKV